MSITVQSTSLSPLSGHVIKYVDEFERISHIFYRIFKEILYILHVKNSCTCNMNKYKSGFPNRSFKVIVWQ